MVNFISMCLSNTTTLENIDDFVYDWHVSDSELELHEYLGMTLREYSVWLTHPDALDKIILSRKLGIWLLGDYEKDNERRD